MALYTLADLHLATDVAKPMDIFGGRWEGHTDKIIRHWRELIAPEDTVVLGGDISWGNSLAEAKGDFALIDSLPGRKIILKGNHDLWWSRITYLNTLYEDIHFLQNDCVLLTEEETGGERIAICGSRGWVLPGSDDFTEHDRKIWTRELGRMRNSLNAAMKSSPDRIIAALHYPPAEMARKESDMTELLREYPVSDCVYGHLHGMHAFEKGIKYEQNGIRYCLTSLDYLGGRPKRIWG